MTTPPTPEAKLISVAAALVRGLPISPQYEKRPLPLWMHRQVAGCEEWARALGVEVRIASDALKAERDQAVARVKELTEARGEQRLSIMQRLKETEAALATADERLVNAVRDTNRRAEKAEARVAVLREALKKAEFHVNLFPDSFIFRLASDALATEDQAADKLLWELNHLRGIVWGDHPAEINKLCAENDKLKAQLDVAVAGLQDILDDRGGSDFDKATAILAKIKALT